MAFNFGSTTKSGFSFGSTSTTKATGTATPFNFGTSAAKTTSSGFGIGAGSLFGSSGSQAASTSTLPSAQPVSTLGKGFGFGGSLGGTSTSTSSTLNAFSTTSAVASKPAFVGLGGVSDASNSKNPNDSGINGNGVSQALKDQKIPDELCKDIKQFGGFLKKQKEDSAEVGRFSVRSLLKIGEEIASLSYALGAVSSCLHRNKAAVHRLRNDFTLELQHVEMAQRTLDIPTSLQHDNIAPVKFFMNLVVEFEANMQLYRRQIEEMENHLNSYEKTTSLSPQDIYLALCKMQESFITLASNLHTVHDKVKNLKEQYLVYRRIVYGDIVDVFEAHRKKNTTSSEHPAKTSGLSPFNQLSNFAALAMGSMVNQYRNQQQQQQAPPQQGLLSSGTGLFGNTTKPTGTASLFGGGTSSGSLSAGTNGNKFGGFGSTAKPTLSSGFAATSSSTGGSLFGNSSFNTSAGVTFGGTAAGSGFQLKHPPVGKRGKK